MNIQLNNWKVQSINFTLLDEKSKREANFFNLETSIFFSEDDLKVFGVVFKVNVKDKLFDLLIDAIFSFNLENEITEEFKLSDFPKINAPAIAFPYIRAFISNLTLQSGIETVILPSINFVKLSEKRQV